MNKPKNIILPISIVVGFIVLGGFFYASQKNKQKSLEKRQMIELQEKKRVEKLKLEQLKEERLSQENKERREKERLQKEFEQTKQEIEAKNQKLTREIRRQRRKKFLAKKRKTKRWKTQILKDINQTLQNYEQVIKDGAGLKNACDDLANKQLFVMGFNYAKLSQFFTQTNSTNMKIKENVKNIRNSFKAYSFKEFDVTEKGLKVFETGLKSYIAANEFQVEQLDNLNTAKEPVKYLSGQMLQHEKALIESIKQFSRNYILAAKDLQEQE